MSKTEVNSWEEGKYLTWRNVKKIAENGCERLESSHMSATRFPSYRNSRGQWYGKWYEVVRWSYH